MIPVGLIGAAVAAAARAGTGARPRKKTGPELSNFLWRAFLAFPLTALAFGVPYLRWVLVPALVFAALPALTLRFVLVPLAPPRVAYWFARISPPIATASETKAAAVLFGSLAALRSPKTDPDVVAWLQSRMNGVHALWATGLAASGFLAVLAGRDGHARLLFEAADSLPSRRIPTLVRRPVQAWLVADAARDGDWRAVDAIARRGWQRWPRLMGLIALRLRSEHDAPSDLVLWLAWLAAPRRLATRPILRRALSVPARAAASGGDAPARSATGSLEEAVAAHAAFVRAPSSATVVRAAQAWDAARAAPSASPLVARRALALQTAPDSALARVFETAEFDLSSYADLAADGAESATLEAAAARARRVELADIETIAGALRDRTLRGAVLDPADEWMEWTALRAMCERARGEGTNLERRRTVFSIVYAAACDHAAWLHNAQGQKLLANSIFRWLSDEAAPVADERTRALLRKNAAAGGG